MENASKALLIAGSILIAIVLIAVGLKVLGSTSGVTEQVGQVSTNLETSIFNQQFTAYAGQQSATEVKALFSLIATSNQRNPNNRITLVGNGTNFSGLNSINTNDPSIIRNKTSVINQGTTYTVSITSYNAEGLVSQITIQ